MKCSECFKKLEKGETIYLSEDMNDHNAYCEECKPKNSFPVLMEKAVPILGRRRGGGEYKEEIVEIKIEEKKKVEEPKIEIPELPAITEKDIQITQGAVIKFDKFESIKKTLEKNSKVYKSLVMTADDDEEYKKFKKIRAQLNTDYKLVDDIRIKVKKDILLPYDTFKENQMDELQTVINTAKENIEKQIDAYELEVKTQKKIDIEEEFKLLQEDYPRVNFIKLENIFDKKWLNTGAKITKIKKELLAIFENSNGDLELIELEAHGARIKTVYMMNGFNFIEAKKAVLSAVSTEAEEQAKIDTAMEENNYKIDNKKIENIVVKTKEEINNKQEDIVVTSTGKVTLKFAITGEESVIKDIVKYMKGKEVVIEQL